jgi:hypothetical protein
MTLAEIIQKIGELSGHDRAILRRELEEMLSKPESQEASPETVEALNKERRSSHDERGIPIEDVVKDPKVDA